MSELLLVHGSCHGAWCWRDVLAELAGLGRPARAINLPGHGADATPLEDVTLDGYADAILAAARGMHGPVTLVGHSMAGYAITAAALAAPDRIARLVYLCAYVPVAGLSLSDMRRAWPDQPLVPAIRPADDGVSFTFDPDLTEAAFYHDCPPGTLDHALARLTPQAIRPQATPLDPAIPDVPRNYVLCEDDRAIPPAYQAHMVRDWPPADVQRMATGHSPFFAAPSDLAWRLARLAADGDAP